MKKLIYFSNVNILVWRHQFHFSGSYGGISLNTLVIVPETKVDKCNLVIWKLRRILHGCEYLVWLTERSTKTRNSERPLGHKWSFNPKAFATGNERCPVKFFKEFVFHRPTEISKDGSPLFLQVRCNVEYTSNKVWYFSKPLGKSSVGEFMSKVRIIENNSCGKIWSHSAR